MQKYTPGVVNRAVPWPRIFLDRSNPIEAMDDVMLFRRYRFRRETMVEIVGLCGDAARATVRSFVIPVVLAVCAYIRYLATGDIVRTTQAKLYTSPRSPTSSPIITTKYTTYLSNNDNLYYNDKYNR